MNAVCQHLPPPIFTQSNFWQHDVTCLANAGHVQTQLQYLAESHIEHVTLRDNRQGSMLTVPCSSHWHKAAASRWSIVYYVTIAAACIGPMLPNLMPHLITCRLYFASLFTSYCTKKNTTAR